jgi:hypothetical protein
LLLLVRRLAGAPASLLLLVLLPVWLLLRLLLLLLALLLQLLQPEDCFAAVDVGCAAAGVLGRVYDALHTHQVGDQVCHLGVGVGAEGWV